MKFDIVSSLELSDAQLEAVYGGWGGSGLGAAASGSVASSERVHSFSVLCDINVFSLNLDLIPIINIADCTNQICANSN